MSDETQTDEQAPRTITDASAGDGGVWHDPTVPQHAEYYIAYVDTSGVLRSEGPHPFELASQLCAVAVRFNGTRAQCAPVSAWWDEKVAPQVGKPAFAPEVPLRLLGLV